MIGIRLADGKYYSVFDETKQNRRRFVLTPANDDQQAVHILFFKADDDTFERPQLLGSVNLDNIPPGHKDEREISITIGLDDDNNFEVRARDESGGDEHQTILNANPESQNADSENFFSEDEFQLNEDLDLPDPSDFIGDREDLDALQETASLNEGVIPDSGPDWDDSGDSMEGNFVENRKPLKPGVTAALVVVVASALVGLSFLVFKLIQGPSVPPMVVSAARTVVSRIFGA